MELGHATASATNARVFQRAYGDPATALAGALLLHGLGEHSQRHEGHLELLAAQGIYSRTFDWPGHGRTAGQRGHLGPMSTITCLIQEQMDALRSDMGTNKQVGLLGHSMGGFLTLYHLARYPNLADFSWVSSTLIDPTANASWLKQKLVRALNHLSPRIPIKSGIRTRDCRVGAARRRDPLMHRWLTVGLGVTLVEASEELRARADAIHPNLRLLMTHGGADRVCTSDRSRAFFDRLTTPAKTYRLFPDVLHEPFVGAGKPLLHAALLAWIAEDLAPHFQEPTITSTKSAI